VDVTAKSFEARPRRERGAAAVEMAIVLPVLLMIIFGIVDFGRMLNAQVTLTEAAREGARSAAVGQTTTETNARVANVTSGMTGVTTDIAGCAGTTDATVTVHYTFSYVTPFAAIARMFGSGPGGTVAMSGKGVMACSS
jgi:Flp pilus assembly protein TadG